MYYDDFTNLYLSKIEILNNENVCFVQCNKTCNNHTIHKNILCSLIIMHEFQEVIFI